MTQTDIDNLALLKTIMENDDRPNVPKVIKRKGEYTKKFLAYNRKLVREGKTFYYADTTQYYDPVKQSFKKKAGKNLKLQLSVDFSTILGMTKPDYSKVVIRGIKRLVAADKKGEVISIQVDMKKLNFNDLVALISTYAEDALLISSVLNSKKWITFSRHNLKRLKKINELTTGGEGSDA